MHELYALKGVVEGVLQPAGFSLTDEELQPDVFGSYYAVFTNDAHEVRFVWDGKDGLGFLQHRRVGTVDWEPVGNPIAEAREDEMRHAASEKWPRALASVFVVAQP